MNEDGMLQIVQILNKLGIETKYYRYQPKKDNYSKVHLIFINRKSERLKFYRKIGFWHDKKTRTLRESLDL